MTIQIPEVEIKARMGKFSLTMDGDNFEELKAFAGDSDLAILITVDDPMSSRYAAYVRNILSNDAVLDTIFPDERDGGIKKYHLSGRKLVVVGSVLDARYVELVHRRVTELGNDTISHEDVRYMTVAEPYKLWKLDEIYSRRGDNGGSYPKPASEREAPTIRPKQAKASLSSKPRIAVASDSA